MNLGCDVQDASDRPVLPGDSGLSAISAHRAMAISLLVQEMRCEARVTGGVHVAVSSSHSTEPLLPLAVARTTRRELARSTTAWNDVLELMAPPEGVLHVTVWSKAAGSQSVLVASRDVRLDELDFNAGFADQRISLLSDCGAKVWLRLAASRRRCEITLLRGGLRPTSPWVQLSPEPDDLAAPYSERRDGSDGTLQPANAPQRKGSTPSAKRVCESGIASICNAMHRFLSTCFSGAAGSSWGRERRSTSQASTTRLQRCSERGRKPLGAAWLSWPWNTLTG